MSERSHFSILIPASISVLNLEIFPPEAPFYKQLLYYLDISPGKTEVSIITTYSGYYGSLKKFKLFVLHLLTPKTKRLVLLHQ